MSAGPATAAPAHDLTNPDALGPWTRRALVSGNAFVYERLTTDGRLAAWAVPHAEGWRWFAMAVSGACDGSSATDAEDAKRAADEALARLDGQPVRSPS